jgi:hypothetical protein
MKEGNDGIMERWNGGMGGMLEEWNGGMKRMLQVTGCGLRVKRQEPLRVASYELGALNLHLTIRRNVLRCCSSTNKAQKDKGNHKVFSVEFKVYGKGNRN